MRILIAGRGFDSLSRRETGAFEADQARALLSMGHDVRFAATDTRSIRRLRPPGLREYVLGGMKVVYCAIPAGAKPAFLSKKAQRSASERIWSRLDAENWRPDIVHAHFGAAMLEEARRRGIPTVYTEHSSRANADTVSAAEESREREEYGLADRLVCVSRTLARRVASRLGEEPVVIPNIADPVFLSAGAEEAVPHEGFRFVSAGNLIPSKCFDILLRAFARLRARGAKGMSLTVIGDGPEEARLRELARTLGTDGSVTFTGRLERSAMAELYKNADAFVLASRSETFGVVLIEALSAGLPVIAARSGGPEDFVDDSNGLLVPADDIAALADAMERMPRLAGRYDRAALAASARERFSPYAVAGALTALYGELTEC